MAMVVYVVMECEWDDSHLFGVYGSQEAAEKAISEALDGAEQWEGWCFDILPQEVQ